MENYNPRQITRMRWKDARELEKFKFFSDNYDLEVQELLENVSQDERYGPIIEAFKEAIRTDREIGVILYDGPNSENTYIGYISREVGYLYTISTTSILIVNLEYDNQRDTLSITNTTEDLLVADNVKTIFGQSISGTGNITMYRHQLTLHATDGEYTTCFVEIYSSNNLKVDSLQALTTLLKPNANTLYTGVSTENTGMPNLVLKYENNIWQIGDVGEEGFILNPVTSVSDIVTSI